jgi:hypothetical protein
MLAPYTAAQYRVSCVLMYQLQLYAQLVLAATATLWSQPASAASANGRCAVSVLALMLLATSLVVMQPLRAESSWYLPMQVHSLVAASLNALLAGAVYGSEGLSEGTVVLSYLSVVATASLALTLVLCFLMSLWVGAQVEAMMPAQQLVTLANWQATKTPVIALLRGISAQWGRTQSSAYVPGSTITNPLAALQESRRAPHGATDPDRSAVDATDGREAVKRQNDAARRVLRGRPDSMDARVAVKAVSRQQGKGSSLIAAPSRVVTPRLQ